MKEMKIWKREVSVEILNDLFKNTMVEKLGIRFTEIGDDYVVATMPVDERTCQSFGLMHGGASCVLGETLGIASNYCTPEPNQLSCGMELNASHLRSGKLGDTMRGVCKPLRLGRTHHVWETRIYNQRDELCCVVRLTAVLFVPKNKSA
jgi:1,4-dihydroxy-2-naphthoyl-CoA hydrolase